MRGVLKDRTWLLCDMRAARRWARVVGQESAEFFLGCARESWRMVQSGGHDVEWLRSAGPDFSGASPAHKWWAIAAQRSGPRLVHERFCVVSDRPLTYTLDTSGRPHNERGPYSEWADGTRAYAWHGVKVPWWVIERPEALSEQVIQAEPNPDIRGIMREVAQATA
jgi:hypothetical protein